MIRFGEKSPRGKGGPGLGGRNLALMVRDRRDFRVAITPKRRELDV